jgi:outer membrane protein assembly factor BamD (BamD/ComL family)
MMRSLLLIPVAFLFACAPARQKAVDDISRLEQELRSDSSMVPDEAKAAAVLSAYDRFVSTYPQDSMVPEYLFRAADLAQGIRHESMAVAFYDRIVREYGNSARAAAALFMEAFVLDYHMGQKDKAKEKYKEFIGRYPQHPLASSAKASVDQIEMGMSDEEMVRMFEQRQDSAATAGR